MMRLLLFVCLLGGSQGLVPDSNYRFEQYEADFSKIYAVGEQERAMRQRLFEHELKIVLSHNHRGGTWVAGINHMSDW